MHSEDKMCFWYRVRLRDEVAYANRTSCIRLRLCHFATILHNLDTPSDAFVATKVPRVHVTYHVRICCFLHVLTLTHFVVLFGFRTAMLWEDKPFSVLHEM
jgi:hypothetical protein